MKDALHANVEKLMKEKGLDALLLMGNTPEHPNFYYLVKGEKLENAVLVFKRTGKKLLFCIDFERDSAAATGFDYITMGKTPINKLALKHANDPAAFKLAWLTWCLKRAKVKGKIAIYGGVPLERSISWLPKMKRLLKPEGIELVAEKTPLLEIAREFKTEAEIDQIREAGKGTFAAFDAVRRTLSRCHARGRTLYTTKGEPLLIGDLKQAIRLALTKHNLVEANPSICSQGAEAGVCHNTGTDTRKVVTGQPIVVDIFPRGPYGYFFDMTRTFCPGKASPKLKKMYNDVKEATTLAYEMYEPGMVAYDLHCRVANLLAEKGYETPNTHPGTQVGFCHNLGHGVGLQVHEEPFMRQASRKTFEPGMVFTIEPGVYYPDENIGFRIEDIAVVRDGYLENLTEYPMEFEVPLKGKPSK
ncbi:MAG: aminopeptidase P family protein [bacterium]|nr:aminopeptidase P family protein [bacterium]